LDQDPGRLCPLKEKKKNHVLIFEELYGGLAASPKVASSFSGEKFSF
jgi:hypothetical protein